MARGYKVLIVDDDKFLLDMYSKKFSESGHDVLSLYSAEEALETVRKGEKFDVLIIDLVMPVMDGFEFLERIRQESLLEKSTIIILSNQSRPQDIEKSKQFGVDGYIVKANTVPSEVLEETMRIVNKKKE